MRLARQYDTQRHVRCRPEVEHARAPRARKGRPSRELAERKGDHPENWLGTLYLRRYSEGPL